MIRAHRPSSAGLGGRTATSVLLASLASIVLFCQSVAHAEGQGFSPIHSFTRESGEPASRLIADQTGRLFGTTLQDGLYGRGSVFVLTPDGNGGYGFETVHSFTGGEDGEAPIGDLIRASDGNIYGVTAGGPGPSTFFRVDAALQLSTLHTLAPPAPTAGLIQASDGLLYGVTLQTVYRLDPSGTGYEIVHTFAPGEGHQPHAALFEASDGKLYGAGYLDGGFGQGEIFRITTGGAYETVYAFGAPGTQEGSYPVGQLMQADDGNLYGTTDGDDGSVYRLDLQGNLTTLHFFDGSDGRLPSSVLVQAADGLLYGTTPYEGPGGYGTVFRLDPVNETFETYHSFDGSQGGESYAGLIQRPDGALYGTLSLGDSGHSGMVFRIDAGGLTTVHGFEPSPGYRPISSLIQGSDGFLYGTTWSGGSRFFGSVFRMSRSGEVTTLHSFSPEEGGEPTSKLLEASDGYFYGTCGNGGTDWGTVFRMDRTGSVTVLHAFSQVDGGDPRGPLVEGGDGWLYGTAQLGGPHSAGTVFRVDGAGGFETAHAFDGDDGESPVGGLVRGGDGALYGVTANGGVHAVGTVFRLETGGMFSTLHAFDGTTEGVNPSGTLLPGADGAFYGTTVYGGNPFAIVFRIDAAGAFDVVHPVTVDEGAYLNDDLAQTADGSFYGTAENGGATNDGTIFRIDPQGQGSAAHSLDGDADGFEPEGGLLLADDGSLYGAAPQAGAYGGGTVFRYTPAGVVSLWRITPSSGPAAGGTAVVIAGYGPVDGVTGSIGGAPAADVVWVGPQEVDATTPALEPGTLADAVLTNPDSTHGTLREAWLADFVDVPQSDGFHASVEKVFRARVTAGCQNGAYCGGAPTTRAQMAVFLLKAKLGRLYAPPAATGTLFDDVPADAFAAAWIEDLANRHITVGCDADSYCPDAPITRAEMAVLLLKTLLGAGYAPPAPTGARFDDVPADAFAAAWIEDLARRGLASGCSLAPPLFCPDAPVTRSEMAAFLSLTFALP